MSRMPLARATAGLSGQPYELGAMDCFRLVFAYLERRGVAMPTEFEGQTLESYPELYRSAPEEAKAMMVRFINSLLPKIAPAMATPGDVLLLRLGAKPPFLAVDAGNGQVLAASQDHGATLYPVHAYTRLGAWKVAG